ncbi:MAG: hypothetical protein MJ233_00200 [Mycoplasmoidaceae bacterium]|nr:hypothetical protein [Mycoplasmoidaceae bacterium]
MSQGCQSAVLGLYIDKKLNLAHHYDDKCEELRSSREYKNLKGKMEEYADKYGLIQANDENEITTEAFEAGYNTFKDATSGES